MIELALARDLPFGWVSADDGYGKEPDFLRAVEDLGCRFVVDVHKDQSIYLDNPNPSIPSDQKGKRKGRKATRLRTNCKSVDVEKYFEELPQT